jgi:hypothetical protein
MEIIRKKAREEETKKAAAEKKKKKFVPVTVAGSSSLAMKASAKVNAKANGFTSIYQREWEGSGGAEEDVLVRWVVVNHERNGPIFMDKLPYYWILDLRELVTACRFQQFHQTKALLAFVKILFHQTNSSFFHEAQHVCVPSFDPHSSPHSHLKNRTGNPSILPIYSSK